MGLVLMIVDVGIVTNKQQHVYPNVYPVEA